MPNLDKMFAFKKESPVCGEFDTHGGMTVSVDSVSSAFVDVCMSGCVGSESARELAEYFTRLANSLEG